VSQVDDRWGIIDRIFGSQRTVMHGMSILEYESEDDSD